MSILKKDQLLDSPADIESQILEFYTQLYTSENHCVDNRLIEKVISPPVSVEDNLMLANVPTMDEVKTAMFDMNGNGGPGLDGF